MVVQCVACISEDNIVDCYLNLSNAQCKCASAPLSVFHRCRRRIRGKVIAADRGIRNTLHRHFIRLFKRNAGDRKVVVEINTGMAVCAGKRGRIVLCCSIFLRNGYFELEEICIVHRSKKNGIRKLTFSRDFTGDRRFNRVLCRGSSRACKFRGCCCWSRNIRCGFIRLGSFCLGFFCFGFFCLSLSRQFRRFRFCDRRCLTVQGCQRCVSGCHSGICLLFIRELIVDVEEAVQICL